MTKWDDMEVLQVFEYGYDLVFASGVASAKLAKLRSRAAPTAEFEKTVKAFLTANAGKKATKVGFGLSDDRETWAAARREAEASGFAFLPVQGIDKVSEPFKDRVHHVGTELGIDPNYLMAVMAFETGYTFSPSIQNKDSGATGLIQFIGSTATKLGTSTDALKGMTAEEQLHYVHQYFLPYKGKMNSLDDVYMVVFQPSMVGKPPTHVVFHKGEKGYDWNSALDASKDGTLTVGEISTLVRRVYDAALKKASRPEAQSFGVYRPTESHGHSAAW
jgi:hypothetical protein